MDKRVYYILGFILLFGIIILGLDFSSKLTGKAIDDSSSDSLSEWTMDGRNFERNNYYPDEINLTNIGVQKTLNISTSPVKSPIIQNGKIYVGDTSGTFYCIDISTGQEDWSYSIGRKIDQSAAIVEGVVYFGTSDIYESDNYVFALNASTGEEIWNRSFLSQIISPIFVDKGNVYFQTYEPLFRSIDAVTGEDLWNSSMNGQNYLFPAYDGTNIYSGGFFEIAAFDASTGNELWNNNSYIYEQNVQGIILKDDLLYVASSEVSSKELWGINKSNGYIVWNFNEATPPSELSVNDNSIFFESGGIIYSVDSTTGVKDWNVSISESSYSNVLASNVFIVSTNANKIYFFDVDNGDILDEITLSGSFQGNSIIVDGLIYVPENTGKIYVLGYVESPAPLLPLSSNTTSLSEWKMFGRTFDHIAWDGIDFPVFSNIFRVTKNVNVAITSSPVVANGYVYVGSDWDNNLFYQLNASNISQVIATYSSTQSFAGQAAVTEDYVYVGCSDYYIYQLNASNVSQMIHSYNLGQIAASPVVANGYVYIGSAAGMFYQLDANDLSQLVKSVNFGVGAITSSPAVAGDYVYIGSGNDNLYQLNASDVTQIISVFNDSDTSLDFSSSPLVFNDYIYVGNDNGYFYQLNASNINQIIYYFITPDDIENSPAYANGSIYLASRSGRIYQLNASDVSSFSGRKVYTVGEYYSSSPAVANGYVYIGSTDNNLYQLNASDITSSIGRKILTTGGDIRSSPAVANGYVYVGSYDNNLYQLTATDITLTNSDVLNFSSFSDNSFELEDEGLALFNTTIENSNGTVYLNINNLNYSSINFGSGIYHVNLTLTEGSYNYFWFGYGLNERYFSSEIRTYVVNESVITEETLDNTDSSGGGSTGLPAESYNLGDLENIDSKVLDLKYGGKISFDLDDEQYNISLKNIDRSTDNVTLEILPIKKDVVLKANENKDVDLNNDLIYDLNLGVGKIAIDEVEVQIALKRKVILRKDIKVETKSVVPVEDTSEEIKNYESISSTLFGWIPDLFNSNKIKCKKLGSHTWIKSLNFCVSSNLKSTLTNLRVFNLLKDEFNFGKSFVQIDEIEIYSCEGCFYIRGAVDNSLEEFYFQDWKLVGNICIPTTCLIEGYKCGEINDGCGRTLNCGECNRGNFCVGGRCIPEPVPLECFDSDEGENYFVKGESTDRWGIEKDRCDGDTLIEAICEGVSTGIKRYDCTNGCEGGVCLPGPWCIDDDPSNNVFIFGTTYNSQGYGFEDKCDSVYTDRVEQFYCNYEDEVIGSNTKTCEFGCSEGICIKGDCSDNDLNDSTIKGIVTDFYGEHEDYCSTSLIVAEGVCQEVAQGSKYKITYVNCPYGCVDGVCIENQPKCSDNDGLNFYNQGMIDYLKSDGNMGQKKDTCTSTTARIGFDTGSGIYNFDFICPPNMANSFPYYSGKMYECPEGCLDGKCITPKNETSYCDDKGYCKLYLGDYLIFDDYLSLNTDYIYTNEGLTMGGDYNYSYPEKTEFLFSLGNGFSVRSGEMNEGNSFDYDFGQEGFFWMNISILNLFSNRDSNVIYDTVAKPYVEFYFEIPDYKSNTKKRKVTLRIDKTKSKLSNSVIYEKPTVVTKVKNFVLDVVDRGDVNNLVLKRKVTLAKDTKKF